MCFWCCATHLLYEYTHSSIGEQGKGIEEKKRGRRKSIQNSISPNRMLFFFFIIFRWLTHLYFFYSFIHFCNKSS